MPGKKTRKRLKRRLLNRRLAVIVGCLLLAAVIIIVIKIYWIDSPQTTDIYPTTPDWHLKKVANDHQVEGYASPDSVIPGGTISFHISCRARSFTADVFRMGWYSGGGAKYMAGLGDHTCRTDSIPTPDKSTGLVNLDWPSTMRLHVPSGWKAGVYLAKLTANDGYQNYVPFTIRTAKPQSNYLFVHSINTDLAYNLWGGNSLYHGRTPDLKLKRAVEASLNRPFSMPGGGNDGAGDFLVWEYPMIRFLEKNDYRVDYATDLDIHEHPNILLKYKAVIITGHDEYWSRQMLEGYKSAVAHGVNLAIFAANTAYRPVRFEPDPLTGEPDRIMVNYKSAALDPFTKTDSKYSTPPAWSYPPLNEPESELLGDSYGGEIENGASSTTGASLVVYDGSSWIFKGTDLNKGDKIPGLVGYEFDEFMSDSPHPANVDIVFHSPLINSAKKASFSDGTYYKLPTGSQVFDAGTMEWSWGLDPSKSTYSPQLVQITRNILNRFGNS